MTENAKVHEVMEGMQKNLARELEEIEPKANLKLNNVLEQCYERSNDNADRFSQCVVESNKRIQDTMEGFQFKMLFLSRSAKGCLDRGSSVQECTDRISQQGKTVIESLLKQIDKI